MTKEDVRCGRIVVRANKWKKFEAIASIALSAATYDTSCCNSRSQRAGCLHESSDDACHIILVCSGGLEVLWSFVLLCQAFIYISLTQHVRGFRDSHTTLANA